MLWGPEVGHDPLLPCTQLAVQLEREKLLAKLMQKGKGEGASEDEVQGKEDEEQGKGQVPNVSTNSISTLDCATLSNSGSHTGDARIHVFDSLVGASLQRPMSCGCAGCMRLTGWRSTAPLCSCRRRMATVKCVRERSL